MKRPQLEPVQSYIALVSAAGLAVLVWLLVDSDTMRLAPGSPALWLLAGLVLLGEMFPIVVSREGETSEITTSTTFSFALLLSWGLLPAVLAQVIGSVVADALNRKSWWKVAFNPAQFTLALAAAAAVLRLLTDLPARGGPALAARDLPGIVLAAAVLFVVNAVLLRAGMALSHGTSITEYLRWDLSRVSLADGGLLALSPIIVVLAEMGLPFVMLAVLPLVAVYLVSRENALLVDRLRGEAQENERQALHDALTSLPNRTLLLDRVNQAVLAAQRENSSLAMMVMDLDRFKEVNDSLGHHTGDLLLAQFAHRLRGALRQSDTVARLGGDEFAVLLPRITDASAAARAADKILSSLEDPFMLQGMSLEVGASIGIAIYPKDGEDPDVLMQRADAAMYAAKGARSRKEMYAAEHDRLHTARLGLGTELRRAIDQEELILYYQPKSSLETGRARGVEALVRWKHPQHGLMAPDDFIPLAEHTGLIRPLTQYVLDAALRQCHLWREQGLELLVAVNLSAQSLLDLNFPDEVAALLEKWRVPGPSLQLEITEGSIMADPMRATRVLSKLDVMRVGLAIDDFGTGYSSLAYLKRLPVREIKIDKSFVMNMTADENDEAIVRSIIDLGRNLELEVVAEGVEDVGAWNRLIDLDCDLAQGYYVTRPLPIDRFTIWLERSAETTRRATAPTTPGAYTSDR